MRAALVLLVVPILALAAPAAGAEEECGFEYARYEPVEGPHVYAETETRECPEGRSLMVAFTDGTGRTSLEWYDDERGLGFEVFRPPYFASWTDTDRGCFVTVFLFAVGETPLPCVAGSPPPPPTLP